MEDIEILSILEFFYLMQVESDLVRCPSNGGLCNGRWKSEKISNAASLKPLNRNSFVKTTEHLQNAIGIINRTIKSNLDVELSILVSDNFIEQLTRRLGLKAKLDFELVEMVIELCQPVYQRTFHSK